MVTLRQSTRLPGKVTALPSVVEMSKYRTFDAPPMPMGACILTVTWHFHLRIGYIESCLEAHPRSGTIEYSRDSISSLDFLVVIFVGVERHRRRFSFNRLMHHRDLNKFFAHYEF